MVRVLACLFFLATQSFGEDLRVDYSRESLTATHVHYQQYLDGLRVVGGERVESIGHDGRHEVVDRLAASVRTGFSRLRPAEAGPHIGELVYLNVNGDARLASRVLVEDRPLHRYANYYDAASGALIRSDPLFWTAQGRVFDPNPVAKLNRPDLQDQNNSAAAVPDAAYSVVDLPDLAPSGPLAGPNVQIVDIQSPFTTRADAAQSLLFDRSQPQFEEVNAYYHIDHSQRYLQSLGFTGPRRIVGYSIPVDPHAVSGTDNSFFVTDSPGRGTLYFGDGGTDDAEDSDIMLHEYGHAIQESIAPGAFGGSSSSQSRALGEGFGDYWSFSSTYQQTVASGRDPFCIGDWDARCWNDDPSQSCSYPVGSDCLRRVDGVKTMANFIVSDTSGTEHKNGEIWSSALREIFMSAGKRTTDTIVLEGTFGVPTGPTYALTAQRLLVADRALNAGANAVAICAAMTARGILGPTDCAPRGEVTLFQSSDHPLTGMTVASTLTISDSRAIDRISVNASIIGEAQATLTGPDGVSASVQSLDVFRGRPAAGLWTLALTANQPMTLSSWSLAIQFAGDQPLSARPASTGASKFIAAVAHAPGANGTTFISDIRLFNRDVRPAQVMAFFTPTGGDGRTNFAAVKITVGPQQIVGLDDIVRNALQAFGTGQLELLDAGENIEIVSRTYTRSSGGTFGQFIPSAVPGDALGSGDLPLSIPGLENTAAFRSNIGFAEVSGASGEIHVRFYDAGGNAVADEVYGIAPFGHVQTRVNAAGEAIRAEVTLVGGARVLPYGSVVDNASGDAIFVPAARVRQGYLPAIHSFGANGTAWRTDVWLSNVGATPELVSLNFTSATVPARGAVVLRDVLGDMPDGSRMLALGTQTTAVLVTSRTYTVGSNGSFGQFVPPGLASSATATLIGLENTAAFRTNIGLIATQSPATVRLIAYDSAGREVWRTEMLAAQGLIQFALPVALADGRLTLEVLAGSGVIPYASVVDNVSGDPIYITAQY